MLPRHTAKTLNGVRFGINEVANGFILDLDAQNQMTKSTYVFNTVIELTQFLSNYIEDNAK